MPPGGVAQCWWDWCSSQHPQYRRHARRLYSLAGGGNAYDSTTDDNLYLSNTSTLVPNSPSTDAMPDASIPWREEATCTILPMITYPLVTSTAPIMYYSKVFEMIASRDISVASTAIKCASTGKQAASTVNSGASTSAIQRAKQHSMNIYYGPLLRLTKELLKPS